jgi:hypothetical protein
VTGSGRAILPCPAANGTLSVLIHRRDGGAPILNANVVVTGPSPGAGITDRLGSVILHDRSPGMYEATITLPPKLVLLAPHALKGQVTAGGNTILNAEAAGIGILTVEVVDQTTGARITEEITIRANGAQWLGKNTNLGSMTFRDIAAGSYTVSTTVPASVYETSTVTQDVLVATGGATLVRLVVRKKPKIVSIAFLDGGDAIEVASAIQFVNLARAPAFIDGAVVANLDRSGHTPRIKVRFDRPGAHRFTVKWLTRGANAAYTSTEKARNARFRYQDQEKAYTTAGDGSKILPLADFFVSAAGKDKFTLEARDDHGISVRSGELEVHRLVYYVELKMRTLTTVATSLVAAEAEFGKHNITLVKLPAVAMDHMPNIGANDNEAFMTKARAAYQTSEAVGKQPCAVAIAYTGQLAVRNPNQVMVRTPVRVGPGEAAVDIPVVALGLTTARVERRHLWQGLVPGESWFVSAKFLRTGGLPADAVDLPLALCTAVPQLRSIPDRSNTVRVNVSTLTPATGTITLIVNVVDRMRAGLSFSGGNLICVCTKAWWIDENTASQNQVIVHELGHKFGMVPTGGGKLPDKTASWYDSSKGHVGNHCFFGNAAGQARYDAATDIERSQCVMYGGANDTSAFCTECATSVRKVDLSDGWSAF